MRRILFLLPFLCVGQMLSCPVSGLAEAKTKAERENGVVTIELKKASLEGEVALSLRRSVEVALERNPDLIVEKIKVERARQKIEEEKGTYDPVWTLTTSTGRRDNLQASRFFPSGVFIEEDRIQEVGFNGMIQTGATYGLNLRFQRTKSTSNTQTLSPQYSATFGFSFTQPLLRDFGLDVNQTRIRVAQKGEEIAGQELGLGVARLIQQVVEAYWNFVFLRQDLGVKKAGLVLAEELLRQNRELLKAGRVTQASVQEARAGVAKREEAVIVSENDVEKAEDRLKLLLHADLGKVAVIPHDELVFEAVDLDPERSISLALKQRPDIVRLRKLVEQRKLETKFAFNQTLPRLDLTTQYGMVGLAGRPNKTLIDPANPLTGSVGDIVAGSAFEGEKQPRDAFDRFFTRSPFDNWSVVLRLEIPLWNQAAKARFSDAKLRLMEARAVLRSLTEVVRAEVRSAIRDTVTARKRIQTNREAVKSIKTALQGTRRKFGAGISTSYEVLQVLDDLTQAKSRELRALMDYNLAQTALSLSEGSLLEKHNVEIKKPPRFVFQSNQ